MTALVTINQGTAPAGSDGDTVRSAFSKVNANVGVLQAQAALTSATGITTAQALTVAHVGKRVNISLSTAGVVNLPAASTCTADSVILLRNIGTTIVTLAITAGSGDTVALSKLNPGESVLMDTDGAHAWNVLTRGRSNSDNEIVIGNCTVNGNETIGGALSVTGNTTTSGVLSAAPTTGDGALVVSRPAGNYGFLRLQTAGVNRWNLQVNNEAESGSNAGSSLSLYAIGDTGTSLGSVFNVARATQVVAFTQRPTFAGQTPWDSGNFTPSTKLTNVAAKILGNSSINTPNLTTGVTIIYYSTFVAPAAGGASICTITGHCDFNTDGSGSAGGDLVTLQIRLYDETAAGDAAYSGSSSLTTRSIPAGAGAGGVCFGNLAATVVSTLVPGHTYTARLQAFRSGGTSGLYPANPHIAGILF